MHRKRFLLAVLLVASIASIVVYQGFGVEPNTGSRVVTIGPDSCGRTSRFYWLILLELEAIHEYQQQVRSKENRRDT